VSSLIVSAFLIGPAVKRLGERRALFLGLGAGAAGFVIYAFASTGLVFLAGIPVIGLYGLANPSIQALMSRHVGASEQGQLQGAVASLMGIAGVIAPALFTLTFAAVVGPFRDLGVPGAPFFLAALFLIAAIVVSERASRSS
jgi:DHA1 family tetracycline resistance protein-like MFS transporter